MFLPILLLDLFLPLKQELVFVIAGLIILYLSERFEFNHELIMNKFKNESKENIKLWKKKLFYLIVLTIVWMVIIFIIYQLLRPDEIQSPYPSEEVIKQLRNIRNSNIE